VVGLATGVFSVAIRSLLPALVSNVGNLVGGG